MVPMDDRDLPHCSSQNGGADLLIDAKGLANLILDWAQSDGIKITPMKLQKLLFFCHADYLSLYNISLVRQNFEAWDYGPVIPSIYSEFKSFGSEPIEKRASCFDPIRAAKTIAVCDLGDVHSHRVRAIYDFYKRLRAEFLSDLSHVRGGPWRHARAMFANGLNMDRRINDDLIMRLHEVPHE